jgi:16S rRNA (guanine1207-N2)-methyltransferase
VSGTRPGARLAAALEAGAVALPEAGRVAVIRPPQGLELPLAPERAVVVHGFRPDVTHWEARGFSVRQSMPEAAAGAIVCLPRSRAQARALVADALALGGPVIVDGQKTDGVDALLRELRGRVEVAAPFAKAHGKCARIAGPPEALADWRLPPLARTVSGWITAPGLFSADGPDPGSAALAAALPATMSGRVADLGAGWGYLAAHVLRAPGVTACDLVEAEHAALEAARANVDDDPRARFHWADAALWTPEGGAVDHVVTNPPFHAGRAADPALGTAFIAAAARVLRPGGTLWLVANRHLPYEAALGAAFRDLDVLQETGGYKLVRGTKATGRAAARTSRHRR